VVANIIFGVMEARYFFVVGSEPVAKVALILLEAILTTPV
jgi:hypothetical protein